MSCSAPTQSAHKVEIYSHPVHCDEELLLGTCANSDGTYSIWAYNWKSDDTQVLARRSHEPFLLRGSSRARLVWSEDSKRSDLPAWFLRLGQLVGVVERLPLLREDYYALDPDVGSCVHLNSFSGPTYRREGWPKMLVKGTDYLLVNMGGARIGQLVLWDVEAQLERGSISVGLDWMVSGCSPPLGRTGELILLWGTLWGSKEEGEVLIRLCNTSPFFEIDSLTLSGRISGIVPREDKNEVLLVMYDTSPEFQTLAYRDGTGAPGLSLAGGEELGKPQGYAVHLGNGLKLWTTEQPPTVHIQEDDCTSPRSSIQVPGLLLCLADDAHVLVVKGASETVRIYSVEFPGVSLIRECRLMYRPESRDLVMERVTDSP